MYKRTGYSTYCGVVSFTWISNHSLQTLIEKLENFSIYLNVFTNFIRWTLFTLAQFTLYAGHYYSGSIYFILDTIHSGSICVIRWTLFTPVQFSLYAEHYSLWFNLIYTLDTIHSGSIYFIRWTLFTPVHFTLYAGHYKLWFNSSNQPTFKQLEQYVQ